MILKFSYCRNSYNGNKGTEINFKSKIYNGEDGKSKFYRIYRSKEIFGEIAHSGFAEASATFLDLIPEKLIYCYVKYKIILLTQRRHFMKHSNQKKQKGYGTGLNLYIHRNMETGLIWLR